MSEDDAAHVLFVDDEKEILTALKRRFRREPFILFTAASAAEALELLRENEIHVIVSDARMPKMSGIELLEEVRRLYPQVVRMMFSGYVEADSLMDAINRAGVFRFITKPWEEEQLRAHILEAIEKYKDRQAGCGPESEADGKSDASSD